MRGMADSGSPHVQLLAREYLASAFDLTSVALESGVDH